MLFVILTYNRKEMLYNLVSELKGKGHDIVIFDDGSQWAKKFPSDLVDSKIKFITNPHGGKINFWKQWQRAWKYINEKQKHEYICFLPDDIFNVQIKAIEALTPTKLQKIRDEILTVIPTLELTATTGDDDNTNGVEYDI